MTDPEVPIPPEDEWKKRPLSPLEPKEEPIDDSQVVSNDNQRSSLISKKDDMIFKEEDMLDNDKDETGNAAIKLENEVISNNNGSSVSIEVNHREISLRNTIDPPKFTGYPDDSDEDIPTPMKKPRVEIPVESIEKIESIKKSLIAQIQSDSAKLSRTNTVRAYIDMDLECPECEYRATTAPTWIAHLRIKHKTTPMLAGLALLCACGNEYLSDSHSRKCNVSKITVIRKRDGPIVRLDGKMTPQCVLCEIFPRTALGYASHLYKHHKSTLLMNGIYLTCSCGYEIRSHSADTTHTKKCGGLRFTISQIQSDSTNLTRTNINTILKCPECEYRGMTVPTWIAHLRRKHNTTPMLAGLALLCACGNESVSDEHSRECNVSKTTVIRKRVGPIKRIDDEKNTPQCVMCQAFPKTTCGYIYHLLRRHKSTLRKNGIYLICSCGLVVRCNPNSRTPKHQKEHSNKCDGRKFSLHKLSEGIPSDSIVPADCNNSGEDLDCGRNDEDMIGGGKDDALLCDHQEPVECINNANDEMHSRRDRNTHWWDIKKTCDLCGKRMNISIVPPDDPVDARFFFDNLIELTPEQRKIVTSFMENNLIANVCLSHFEEEKTSELEVVRKSNNNTTIKEDAVCYICGEPTADFCVPPIVDKSFSSTRVRAFFDELINLNPVQRQRANYYRDKGLGTTVCKKHVCGSRDCPLHKSSDEARTIPPVIQQSPTDVGDTVDIVPGDIPPLFMSIPPEEIKEEVKEEIKEEMKEEIKGEFKEEIKEEEDAY